MTLHQSALPITNLDYETLLLSRVSNFLDLVNILENFAWHLYFLLPYDASTFSLHWSPFFSWRSPDKHAELQAQTLSPLTSQQHLVQQVVDLGQAAELNELELFDHLPGDALQGGQQE